MAVRAAAPLVMWVALAWFAFAAEPELFYDSRNPPPWLTPPWIERGMRSGPLYVPPGQNYTVPPPPPLPFD
ncbi:hypothetical protein AAMO2058_000149300 [Amorphochlora amoebiformis]|eukprot:1381343-Amorphochlora_amoeboformis.AAC.2